MYQSTSFGRPPLPVSPEMVFSELQQEITQKAGAHAGRGAVYQAMASNNWNNSAMQKAVMDVMNWLTLQGQNMTPSLGMHQTVEAYVTLITSNAIVSDPRLANSVPFQTLQAAQGNQQEYFKLEQMLMSIQGNRQAHVAMSLPYGAAALPQGTRPAFQGVASNPGVVNYPPGQLTSTSSFASSVQAPPAAAPGRWDKIAATRASQPPQAAAAPAQPPAVPGFASIMSFTGQAVKSFLRPWQLTVSDAALQVAAAVRRAVESTDDRVLVDQTLQGVIEDGLDAKYDLQGHDSMDQAFSIKAWVFRHFNSNGLSAQKVQELSRKMSASLVRTYMQHNVPGQDSFYHENATYSVTEIRSYLNYLQALDNWQTDELNSFLRNFGIGMVVETFMDDHETLLKVLDTAAPAKRLDPKVLEYVHERVEQIKSSVTQLLSEEQLGVYFPEEDSPSRKLPWIKQDVTLVYVPASARELGIFGATNSVEFSESYYRGKPVSIDDVCIAKIVPLGAASETCYFITSDQRTLVRNVYMKNGEVFYRLTSVKP